MDQFIIALTQIGIFLLLILTGILVVKVGLLNEGSLASISNLVIKVSLPCYIFINACESATLQTLTQSIIIVPMAAAVYIILIFICMAIERVFGLKGNRKMIYRASLMFGNIGFMGIPFVSVLYPENAVLYVSVFTIVDQLFFWTYGVGLTKDVNSKKQAGASFDFKNLISPPLAAIVLAIIFIVAGVRIPTILSSALSSIGSTSMPLALMYIGGILCITDIRPVLKSTELYAGIIVKMTALPIVFYMILRVFNTAADMAGTVSFMIALPGVEIVPMLAKANGSDGDYSVCAIMMTTIASLVTLPIVSLAVSLVP